MEQIVDVAIIGAGSAGLTAYKEARKASANVVLLQDGPLGTTCARVGCMPSKVLIQVADDFHRRHAFASEGILGAEALRVDSQLVMQQVRKLRDRFVRGILEDMEAMGDRHIRGRAKFLEPTVLRVGLQTVRAKRVVIATGTTPLIPEAWESFGPRLLTTDALFEMEMLPRSMAVLGLGAIGIELGQALKRLGVAVTGVVHSKRIAGIRDPEVNAYALETFGRELPLWLGEKARVQVEGTGFRVDVGTKTVTVESVLACMGRLPNVKGLGLENLGVPLDEHGLPMFDEHTMQVGNLPVYLAGDVNARRPILHEAVDDGRIAGYNAGREISQKFHRRTPLRIVFTEPNVACAGLQWDELPKEHVIIGSVDFSGQGRSIIKGARGLLRVYADKRNGKLLGSEMLAPSGEHMAFFLASAIQQGLTVFDVLRFPFYHPVVEEGLRTALRDLAKQVATPQTNLDLAPFP